jgi:hypothetical protein
MALFDINIIGNNWNILSALNNENVEDIIYLCNNYDNILSIQIYHIIELYNNTSNENCMMLFDGRFNI